MTVDELRAALAGVPGDLDVTLATRDGLSRPTVAVFVERGPYYVNYPDLGGHDYVEARTFLILSDRVS